jgi:two-component system, chemotaxis family, sensor kinase CheA
MSELQDMVEEFLVECAENLDQLDRALVTLEQDPTNRDGLASIFRTFHTIKGTCCFFDFHQLGALTHAGETLLAGLRDGKLVLTPPITSALLCLVDTVRRILDHIERSGDEGKENHDDLIQRLTWLTRPGSSVLPSAAVVHPVPAAPGQPLLATPPGNELPSPSAPPAEEGNESFDPHPGLSEGTIRVDVALLDKLMNLVGELVLARNQILQCTSPRSDPVLLRTSQRLNLITSELQEGFIKTRMQPIANIWKKFPRVSRDLALTCGKQVRLTMEGKDTELDRSIIESIKDPLTHLLRNAIDHGIESPTVRLQLGKPAEGNVGLRA